MSESTSTIKIVIYRITGQQGPIDVPHRYCEECDLTVQLTKGVLDELGDARVQLDVKPWMLYFWKPIWRGGWHAPIVTINGQIFSQGIVPDRTALKAAIQNAGAEARTPVDAHIGHHSNPQ
jgi:hypothetical protein